MKDLLGVGLTFIAIAVVLVIGTAIVVQTSATTQNITGNSTLLTNVVNSTGNAITTFASLLGIFALAAVGGMSLLYVLGFLRGGTAE